MTKTLRPYQEAAIQLLWRYLHTTQSTHPLVVAPVGAGKSLLIAEFIKRIHQEYPRTRIVMVTHVKELLTQNMEELKNQYIGCDAAYFSAGLNQKRLNNDITYASIQSVWEKANEFNRAPELILVDECHLIPHNTATRYRKFIDDCLALNPNLRVIGFTGTPFRADSGRLDEGKNRLFNDVAYEISMRFMFDEGWLCRPIVPATETILSAEGVHSRGGDYIASELEAAVNKDELTKPCVQEIIKLGADRKRWLVFAAGISHCESITLEMQANGIDAEMITGKTPKARRKEIIERYNKGELKCLVNVAVLTTGFNSPPVDLLAFMRPTRSPVLYVQTVGRGLRPVYEQGYDLNTTQGRLDAIENSQKKNCLVLDFGQVIESLGAIDKVEIRKKDTPEEKTEKGKEKEKKICPACAAVCFVQQMTCHACGYVFFERALKLTSADKESKIISEPDMPITYKVIGMKTYFHAAKEEGKSPTMRVEYATMFKTIKEWVSFEGGARFRGEAWHKNMLPHTQAPKTVAEALLIQYPKPDTVDVIKEGDWDRVQKVNLKGAVYNDIPFIL